MLILIGQVLVVYCKCGSVYYYSLAILSPHIENGGNYSFRQAGIQIHPGLSLRAYSTYLNQ